MILKVTLIINWHKFNLYNKFVEGDHDENLINEENDEEYFEDWNNYEEEFYETHIAEQSGASRENFCEIPENKNQPNPPDDTKVLSKKLRKPQ